MKRSGILLCILCLVVYAASPTVLADSLFSLLDPPATTQSPEPMQPFGFFGTETTSDSQELFDALETPEPTPFPTPVPRIEAKGSKKSGNFTFRVLPDGSAEIIAYNGKDKTLSIPIEMKKYPVSSIGDSAFANTKTLIELEIPEGVTGIETWAFGCCQKLTKVTLHEGLATIGDFAFADCPVLSLIHIPNSVVKIGQGVFERAQPGEELTIEVCKGSYAEHYFQNLGYSLSYYIPATPSPTPITTPRPIPSYTNHPAPINSSSYIEPYNPYDIEIDCPTCLGIGGCRGCLYGDVDCPDCVGGRCSECGGTRIMESYDFAKHDVKKTNCRKCGGTGECKTCRGGGRIPCETCRGTGRCPTCGK